MAETSRTVLVIGATGGIGSAVSARLDASGARVVAASRSQARLDALDLSEHTARIVLDARDQASVDAGFAAAVDHGGGRLDGVVLAVGSILLKPAHLTSLDEFRQCLAQNLETAFLTVRAAAQSMRKTGGSVVLCSTVAASLGLPNHEAIAAAKGGVESLTRAAAASYAGRGIRFNAVAPGLTRTPLTESITSNARALEHSEKLHPLGRIGEPDDVASAIVWLLEPASSWVTGQVLGVDGGLSTLRPATRA